ncbi:Proteasome subunit beta type-7 [Phytophthora cactorum]|uniref:Proteasome subunit beta n=1 Tax=Phytophthora cactorum TaxID=29920 RepID=A0A8T1GRL1_9STRA|nr:Proteasome subunit beta type-7 [Phytophthora cactorum]KAG2843409.1 Proteasome subunit beta type-7 [Phytophthora cactorum]KAG2845456.1 Proteasome subunit beta type-7 [Phytophthora cactorum]KAG2867424.1 Proteasome subunit beta type-7 [Phytophthora cactorum]KAG2930366.1 Proteasome subunit beta type-7 [Phytophthora cactorum]
MSDFRRTQNTFGDAFPTAEQLHGGFSFDNCRRNELLLSQSGGKQKLKATKTGTTIVGVVYKDGVVLGADTRSTGGSIVMDKNCEKIHYIAPNIYCCGAGTAADTENTTALISSQLELHRLNTDTQSRVVTAMTLLKKMLFQYQGHVSAALVLGGVDITGPHLYTIYPHGSTDKLPFVTMGSGSLAAMSVFEHGYKDDMTEDDAKKLVQEAILAGIFNDLGSGSNVDVTTIKKVNGKVEVVKEINCIKPNEVSELRSQINRDIVTHIPRGATHVLSSKTELFPANIVVEEATPMEL